MDCKCKINQKKDFYRLPLSVIKSKYDLYSTIKILFSSLCRWKKSNFHSRNKKTSQGEHHYDDIPSGFSNLELIQGRDETMEIIAKDYSILKLYPLFVGSFSSLQSSSF